MTTLWIALGFAALCAVLLIRIWRHGIWLERTGQEFRAARSAAAQAERDEHGADYWHTPER